jgi:hypothetical protein
LQILKQIYVAKASSEVRPIPALGFTSAAVLALAIAVVVLGCAPGLLVERFAAAFKLAAMP